MHLLSIQAGELQQDGEAIDPGQSPADILFLSAADTELASLALAADNLAFDQLRVANTMHISHNLSVDLWLEQTASRAKLVVVRLLGGRAYWPYGTDQLGVLCRANNIHLALLPGDAHPDPDLLSRSTLDAEICNALHALFVAGGQINIERALAAMRNIVDGESAFPAPRATPRAGIYDPAGGVVTSDRIAPSPDRPVIPIIFYKALLDGGMLAPVNALIEVLSADGLLPLPVFVSSLKEPGCVDFVRQLFRSVEPDVILNITGFALGITDLKEVANPFSTTDAPVIQLVQSGRPSKVWQDDFQGLGARDLAMQVVLPELDGRIGGIMIAHKEQAVWHERTQYPISSSQPDMNGVRLAARLAGNWVTLRRMPPRDRKIGIVLANYPVRDGRIANGVGYDAPQSTVEILRNLARSGYSVSRPPANGNALVQALLQGPTNADPGRGESPFPFPLEEYRMLFDRLPPKLREDVSARWGNPVDDPFFRDGVFHLPVLDFGNAIVMLQPSRGYDLDPEASYHDPDLVPPHGYFAAYFWLKHRFGANAIMHNGKHGNLEWLPGKANALGPECYPQQLWSELPHLYPFIVNDPGEGSQAKRRTGAVIIDHLTPPLTRAETYGPLKDLEALADEYYNAAGLDQRRLKDLAARILDLCRDTGLDRDMGLEEQPEDNILPTIDTFLCELKEAQIRNGLHIFGTAPRGQILTDLLVALARVPRGGASDGDQSLVRALADDLALGFDPLSASAGRQWAGPKPAALQAISAGVWRHAGHTIERLEFLAAALVSGEVPCDSAWKRTGAVLEEIRHVIAPKLEQSGDLERKNLLRGLDGKFVQPGPSGAPTRGRLDVLPTGRNFYSVDNRAIPTPTAWELGQKSAENIVTRHFQDHGTCLQAVALSVWGTSTMRTGGDDLAQAMALIGAKPKWDIGSRRVSGYEIIPLARLGRPRVDVTLRISGFFRDAFPAQIALFDKAVRAIGALDEPSEDNPVAARMRADTCALLQEGLAPEQAAMRAGYRIFGSKPGAYGAGLQGIIDNGNWKDISDIATAFLNWGQYAYGNNAKGDQAADQLAARLTSVDAIVHNQDNREHDLLDSDDYYQFEGGLTATATALSGSRPVTYHNDHSRPERPVTRTLDEEIARVMRARVVNPKWIAGVKRHGYKGAFEIIATTDFMLAFAATTGAVKSHHFDIAFDAFVLNDDTRNFIRQNNSHGYCELIARFKEAIERGYWSPRKNSIHAWLDEGTVNGHEQED